MKSFIPIVFLLGLGACPIPSPTPTPEPPTPTPTPLTCANVDCQPGYHCVENPGGTPKCIPDEIPPQPVTACPKELAEGAYAYVNNKPYGQGFDSAYRVHGDPQFCAAIHGIAVDDCNLEGWPKRVECELELGGGCPVWQFMTGQSEVLKRCSDNQSAEMSCDHFGDPTYRDDPKTPTSGDTLETLVGFEGQPKQCGLQRDGHGPMAGYFTIAHGLGRVRACRPDNTNCGPWQEVDH